MFAGIHAVLYALFQSDGRIDPGAMQAEVGYCLEKGCHGVTVLGLATEVFKLTPAERRQMIEIAAPAAVGKVPFSVTIAGNSVAEQSETAKIAKENGADWLILQPPMAETFDASLYLDFFAQVAASTPLPIAIQNAPQYLGRGLSAGDVARLKELCPNLKAIKAEDPAEGLADMIKVLGDDFAVLGGRGGQGLIESLDAGAGGFVLAPDIAPVACRIYAHWTSGQKDKAAALFDAASPAIEFTMQSLEHLIAYGKRSFAEQAGLAVFDRPPTINLKDADVAAAREFAQKLSSLVG